MTSVVRRRGVVLAIAIVVLLAATLALRLYSGARLERALRSFETATGGLRFVELAPPRIEPRKDNAAFWLRSGVELLIYDENEFYQRRVREIGSPWSEADQQAFLALLAANEPARSLMDRAASLERSSFEVEYREGAEAEIPNFLPFLHAARLLGVECDFHQQRGELDRALATLHLLERLAAVQRAEPMLISLLTGVATERMYLDRLEAILRDARDPAVLRAVAQDLDHLEAATVEPGKVFAADVGAGYPTMLRRGFDWPEGFPEPPSRAVLRRLRPLLWATGLDRLNAAIFVEAGQRAVASVQQPAAAMSPEDFDREVLRLDALPPGIGTMARTMAPNYLSGIQREQWGRSARVLARLAVELSRSRAGDRHFPSQPITLPIAAATGETATYETDADGSVEIAFPQAEAGWAEETKRVAKRPGVISTPDFNLRWRLDG